MVRHILEAVQDLVDMSRGSYSRRPLRLRPSATSLLSFSFLAVAPRFAPLGEPLPLFPLHFSLPFVSFCGKVDVLVYFGCFWAFSLPFPFPLPFPFQGPLLFCCPPAGGGRPGGPPLFGGGGAAEMAGRTSSIVWGRSTNIVA